MAKKKTHARKRFYQRKGFLWTIGTILSIIIIILLAFRLSPWPGAILIRTVFEKNGGEVLTAMQKHTPSSPVEVIANQSYRAHDGDALLDVYMPQSVTSANEKLPVIVWTHGGAWLSGSKDDDAPYFKLLASAGYVVVAPNYTLAPKQAYPYQVHQLNDAHKYMLQNADRFHINTDKIFLAGDSAGAQLSSQLAALATSPAYAKEVGVVPVLKPAQLKGVILNCGIYKMEGLTHPNPALPKIIGWGDDITVWAYAGTRDFSDPVIRQMSPYYHVTKDFPATYISGGNADPLTDAQSKPLAEKLKSLGVKVSPLFYAKDYTPALPHEYQFNLDTQAGQQALGATIDFVAAQ